MRRFLTVLVLLVGCFAHCFGDVDFFDCGSDLIDVETVLINGCDHDPCLLRRGETYEIVITPSSLDPQIDSVNLNVKAEIRGALFDVNASFVEPCGIPCPIDDKVISPEIPINVNMDYSLLRGLAPLIVNVTYMNGNVWKSRFCIEFEIYIS